MKQVQFQPGGGGCQPFEWRKPAMPAIARVVKTARHLLSDRRGATIVEFAIVSPLLIALLFGLFETSLTFFIQESLETVTEKALRTSTTASYPSDDEGRGRFLKDVCQHLPPYMKCANLRYDVASYSNSSQTKQQTASEQPVEGRFKIGGPGDIIILKLVYQWPLNLSPLSVIVRGTKSASGSLLIATRVGKSELPRT
ncbi:TadE/TadG family type IV pilus assembly protein [Sphingomonas sp. Mn802worker]|uniref:TadE/TadG family type IV pilus assembly protein n=1 Tax=Sphingomonas sp. Mn802worker TaxID=629773 RepID=UPI0003762E79|nr:TadE/TadG family type IV pilus assembly protein [Sphingomonas sp. Mn802worker]